jgi:cell division protein FtsZ
MVLPGLINLDFADVRTVMTEMGKAMMGTGEATGEDRALMAAQNAIANPLLDEVSLKGAKAVLVNVTGGLDMTLLEVDEAANAISEQVDTEANIIFGAAFDPSLDGMIRVSVVATGMDGASIAAIEPKVERKPLTAPPLRAETSRPAPVTEPVIRPAAAYERPAPTPTYAERPAAPPAPRYPEPAAYVPPTPVTPVAAAPEPEPTIAAFEEEEQGDLYAAPAPAPVVAAAPEPQISRPITKIVDPAVEEMEEPLFSQPAYEERRPQRGGFLSLFGSRPRYDQQPAPQPTRQAVSRTSAMPVEQPMEEAQVENQDDLEIPSFLRRLAN